MLTAGDQIGAIMAGLTALMPATMPMWSGRIAKMFDDFGGTLPLATKLVLQPWFGPLLAMLPIGLLFLGVAKQGLTLERRRALIVGAFLAGVLVSAFCVYAIYLPIFELADAIK